MRFTDTFLRQVRDRVSIADFAGKRLAWDKRKSRPAAGDFCAVSSTPKKAPRSTVSTRGHFQLFRLR